MAKSRAAFLAGLAAFLLSSVAPLDTQAAAPAQKTPADNIAAATALTATILALTAGDCDALASPPSDPNHKGPGVTLGKIDVARALPACERAAKQSPIRPRNQYLYGRVLDAAQRYTEAAEQYAAADKAGYRRAAGALGGLYYLGFGVPKDVAKAISLYRRAGDAGYADAYAILGTIYLEQQPPNYRQAIAAYDRASRTGSALGLVGLGELYGAGAGVTKNQIRAVSLFQQAADKGESLGMFDLGVSYLVGAGVMENPEMAFRWLLRAAELDIPQAQNAVAHMYEDGEGVEENSEQAMYWYRLAVARGDIVAMERLAHLLDDAGKNEEAIALYKRSAEAGYADAQTALGIEYRTGAYLPKDYGLARQWFDKAIAQGDGYAMIMVGEMYENGWGNPQDYNTARAFYTRALNRPIYQQIAQGNLSHLDFLERQRQPQSAQPDPYGRVIVSPPGYDTQQQGQERGSATPPPAAPSPEPPYRPLPTQRVDSGLSDEAATLLAIGIVGGVWWLLSGSGGGSSGGGVIDSGSSSSGGGGFSGGGGGLSPPSERPVSTPMNGDITRTLHGEDALGLNGQVNRR